MRNKLLLLIIILLLGSLASPNSGSVSIDLEKGDFSYSGLERGKGFSVTVTGRNWLRYSLGVKVEGKELFRDAPVAFEQNQPTPGEAGGGAVESFNDADSPSEIIDLLTDLVTLSKATMTAIRSAQTQEEAVAFANILLEKAATLTGSETATANAYISAFNKGFEKASAIRRNLALNTSPDADAQRAEIATLMNERATLLIDALKVTGVLERTLSGSLFEQMVGPYQATGDAVVIKITITDKDGEDAEQSFTYEVPISRGFKIDFSAGLMHTSLYDLDYTTTSLGGDPPTFSIDDPKSPNGRFETTAFIHFRGFLTGANNFSLTLGVMPDDRPVYSIGLSYHVQSLSQRLVLTGGLAIGQVERYDGDLSAPISTPNVPVRARYMSRPFIALSYNF